MSLINEKLNFSPSERLTLSPKFSLIFTPHNIQYLTPVTNKSTPLGIELARNKDLKKVPSPFETTFNIVYHFLTLPPQQLIPNGARPANEDDKRPARHATSAPPAVPKLQAALPRHLHLPEPSRPQPPRSF